MVRKFQIPICKFFFTKVRQGTSATTIIQINALLIVVVTGRIQFIFLYKIFVTSKHIWLTSDEHLINFWYLLAYCMLKTGQYRWRKALCGLLASSCKNSISCSHRIVIVQFYWLYYFIYIPRGSEILLHFGVTLEMRFFSPLWPMLYTVFGLIYMAIGMYFLCEIVCSFKGRVNTPCP